MRRRAQRRSRTRRRRRSGSLWRWLGLGALGLAAAALVRGERRTAARREPRRPPPGDAPEAGDGRPVLEPPDDVEVSWVAGPAGTLRVVERHRQGGLPIVFVHGLGGRAEHWSALLAAVGPAIRAVALDLPGHGGSDRPADGDGSVAALAAAIGAAADGLGLRRIVVVAHSLGAAAAIEYAATHPGRVAGLLLVDPGGDQTRVPAARRRQLIEQLEREPAEELGRYFRQILIGAEPEVAERVLADLAATPTDVVLRALEGGQDYAPLPALAGYAGPLLSVISDLNSLPYSLHNLVPDLPVRHLGGASHWLMMDRPDELWAILVDFLEELPQSLRGARTEPENAPPAYN